LLLAFGQTVRRHQSRCDPAWVGRFDDHGNSLSDGRERHPMQDNPCAGTGQQFRF
jgi:hypothetical protein